MELSAAIVKEKNIALGELMESVYFPVIPHIGTARIMNRSHPFAARWYTSSILPQVISLSLKIILKALANALMDFQAASGDLMYEYRLSWFRVRNRIIELLLFYQYLAILYIQKHMQS